MFFNIYHTNYISQLSIYDLNETLKFFIKEKSIRLTTFFICPDESITHYITPNYIFFNLNYIILFKSCFPFCTKYSTLFAFLILYWNIKVCWQSCLPLITEISNLLIYQSSWPLPIIWCPWWIYLLHWFYFRSWIKDWNIFMW